MATMVRSRDLLLAAVFATAPLAAQEEGEDWNRYLLDRMESGEDLIELRYQRDEHGLLEVASCKHGAIPFHPMFPADRLPRGDVALNWLCGTLLLLGDGASVLASTDAERHLRRAGIDTDPVALRQFLVAPMPAGDPVRERVEVLDRLVAIDWLVRSGHRGVIAELTALAANADTPPMLAQKAEAVLAAFGKRPPTARQQLTVDTLRLPVTADVYVVIDHARLPDLLPLRVLARRMAIESSYDVVRRLRAPTPDDLFYGQFVADALGEMPFEIARRFGDVRFDHTVIAANVQVADTGPQLAFAVHSVGAFDPARAAGAFAAMAAATPARLGCERRDAGLCLTFGDREVTFDGSSLRAHSKGMAGRPRPAVAATLLVDAPAIAGPAIRIVVPKTSKLWLAVPALRLPAAAEEAVLTLSFGATCRAAVTLTVRDEDAAAEWAERCKGWVAAAADAVRLTLDQHTKGDGAKEIPAAIAAAKVSVTGARVEVTAECPIAALFGQAVVTAVLAEVRARAH